jgi:hypothetical protein
VALKNVFSKHSRVEHREEEEEEEEGDDLLPN